MRPSRPVQHVRSQRVPFGYTRMIEVAGEIALHADALHHTSRSMIVGSGERNDFLQLQQY